ncbi:MAG: RNA methyltransferase [Eggerthellaceae bacterium]|nr:RNA methyltransferase [Eggerthellaceae bacterium]
MPLIRPASHDDPRLSVFSAYTDAELRDPRQLVGLARSLDASADPNRLAAGLFIAESANVIERALDAGAVPVALLAEERWAPSCAALAERARAVAPEAPAFVVTAAERRAVTGLERTRGPLAAFLRPTPADPAALVAGARRMAVLEDITNYTNVGAVFRSAAALGIDAVLLTERCHDPLYRRAARVSMGTVLQVPWARVDGAWPALLRAAGFVTCALALADDALAIDDARLREADRLALVLGTEGDGLAPATIAACDVVARIPMAHGVDSLNVAAASAVAFWETRVREA